MAVQWPFLFPTLLVPDNPKDPPPRTGLQEPWNEVGHDVSWKIDTSGPDSAAGTGDTFQALNCRLLHDS